MSTLVPPAAAYPHCRSPITLPPMPSAPAPPATSPTTSPMYSIDTNGQLEPHLHQEWLLTNGLGGFASTSVVGCNTRRYHGVLVAATLPPGGRGVGLNRIGEDLKYDRDHPPAEGLGNPVPGRVPP